MADKEKNSRRFRVAFSGSNLKYLVYDTKPVRCLGSMDYPNDANTIAQCALGSDA